MAQMPQLVLCTDARQKVCHQQCARATDNMLSVASVAECIADSIFGRIPQLEKEVETLKVTQSSEGSGQQDEELTRLKREVGL